MSKKKEKTDGVAGLVKLADRLEKQYPEAGDRVAELIEPVDDAIRRVGATFQSSHYAENRQYHIAMGYAASSGTASHRYAFASEATSDGQTEYALCAARGRGRACGLYVSVCTYEEFDRYEEDEDGEKVEESVVRILSMNLVRPNELPLQIRIKILDKLDYFVEGYQNFVMEDRKALLNGAAEANSSG